MVNPQKSIAHGGTIHAVLSDWRALADPAQWGSSVRELARHSRVRIAGETALAEHRKINRQIERAWRAEQRRLKRKQSPKAA